MNFFDYTHENFSFLSKLSGAVRNFENKGASSQIGFVDEATYSLAKGFFCDNSFKEYSFISLRKDSVRKFLVIGDEHPDFVYVCARPDKFHFPSHRDYMGALMSLGIDRKFFGDILVSENFSAYFTVWNNSKMPDYVFNSFTSCAGAKIRLEYIDSEEYNSLQMQFEDMEILVPSLRIDCFATAITGKSRSQVKSFIENGNFKLFSSPVLNPSAVISIGDVFSIKGYGKFIFFDTAGTTRRDKLRIVLKKFGNYIERK